MKREWLGVTLAFGLGLTASAWAVKPVPGHPGSFAPVKLQNHSTQNLDNLQLLAMAGSTPRKAHPTKAHASNTHAGSGSGSLNSGIASYKSGFIAKAIPCFEHATQQNPQSEMAFLWLARATQKQGTADDIVRAKAAYQHVLALNPNNLEALAALGEIWSWDPAMRGEAIGLLKHAYTLNSNDAKVSKTLAEALLWQGNAAEALRYASPIADLYRNDHKWLGEYAQMLSAGGRTDEAIKLYSTILKDDGDRSVYLRMDQARAVFSSGNRADASALFDQIAQSVSGKKIAANPDFIQAMGSLAFDLERYNEALQWDQALPSAYQRHKDIQLREARALTKSSRVPEAIDHFYHLYEAGLLTVDEKIEFAEYLRVLHLAPDALPTPNLVETLYQEAVQEGNGNPEVQLRLARYYGETPERFEDAVKAYQVALASTTISNPEAVKKEFLDFLKSDKTQPVRVEGMFKEMLTAAPDDIQTKAAYAEYLSWQKERRVEAMRLYVELEKADPANQEVWQGRIDEVLKWHTPTTALIPMYQEIVNLFPQDKAIWMTVARAYRNDKDYYKEALDTYGTLVQRYPDDGTLKREWLGLLLSNAPQRSHNIAMLKKMVDANPNDPDVLATYGKLLSYEHNYGPAMDAFQRALRLNAKHREALVGKGYVILWSGRKLEAKSYFLALRNLFPDDVDIAIGLAQAEKSNGRYDQALQIMQDIKPLVDQANQKAPESGAAMPTAGDDFRLVDHWEENSTNYSRGAVNDFSILPYADDAAPTAEDASAPETNPVGRKTALNTQQIPDQQFIEQHLADQHRATQHGIDQRLTDQRLADQQIPAQRLIDQQKNEPAMTQAQAASFAGFEPTVRAEVSPVRSATERVEGPTVLFASPERSTAAATTAPGANYSSLQAQVNALSKAANSLKQAQESSRSQLDHLDETIRITRDAVPTEINLQPNDNEVASTMRPSNAGASTTRHSVGESAMTPTYGVYSALDYDTNPLLSGLGRFRNDDLNSLEKGLTNDLRPMIRGGYLYTQQKGESTTTRLSSQGFPNQLSFSLTPQIRLRGGIRPTRYYLPQGKDPSSNLGIEYSLGGTVKYWDHLTLDGDFAVTNFRQTQNVNLTYQGQAQYAFNDAIRLKLGVSRLPQFNSLLTVAGQRPSQGFYQGQVLGQARENSFYGELNTNPFNQNWDFNVGYAWALVTGSHIPNNTKNQMFTSLGHSWNVGANHKLRLGYEFLYFGYGKNATSGFFDTTALGLNVPVSTLGPVTAASSKYVFGGYYSPTFFMMNAGRLDMQGSWLNKLVEYKVGGSLGVQTTAMGHNIHNGSGSRISGAVDGNVILNMTDWLAAYGDVDFLNAGGQFNRWRFGGGLIVRPHIDALSPMFGGQKMAKAAKP
jgi:tetratricopeptide (TPR) repeat protein